MTRIIIAGATGWVGKALVQAVATADDLTLAGAVSRSASGWDAGEAAGGEPLGVAVSGSLAEALAAPSDVLIDYTKPNVVKGHVLEALAAGRHVVVGTSGLSAKDYAEIDKAAENAGRAFSLPATSRSPQPCCVASRWRPRATCPTSRSSITPRRRGPTRRREPGASWPN